MIGDDMQYRALPIVVALALFSVGCGVSDNDDGADSAPATNAANDQTADTTGDPQPIAAASAEAEPYFRAVEASALTLSLAVEGLFSTPLGLETEEIAERLYVDGTPTGDITAAEEATLREFFTTFWTDAAGHVDVLGDDLRALDPPDILWEPDDELAAMEAACAALDAEAARLGIDAETCPQ